MPLGTRSQGYGYEPQAQAGCGQMRCEPRTWTPTGTWTVPASCVLCAGRWVSAAWVAKLGCWCCLVFRVHAEPAVFTLGVYSKYSPRSQWLLSTITWHQISGRRCCRWEDAGSSWLLHPYWDWEAGDA